MWFCLFWKQPDGIGILYDFSIPCFQLSEQKFYWIGYCQDLIGSISENFGIYLINTNYQNREHILTSVGYGTGFSILCLIQNTDILYNVNNQNTNIGKPILKEKERRL